MFHHPDITLTLHIIYIYISYIYISQHHIPKYHINNGDSKMLQGEGFQLPPLRGHDKRQQGMVLICDLCQLIYSLWDFNTIIWIFWWIWYSGAFRKSTKTSAANEKLLEDSCPWLLVLWPWPFSPYSAATSLLQPLMKYVSAKKELWIFYMLNASCRIAERQQDGQSGSCPVWIWAQHSICANQVRPRRWNYGGGEIFEMLGLPMPVLHCFFPSFPSWHSQRVAKGLGTQASAQPICNAGREHRHCMALSSTSFSGRLPAKRDVSVGLICESSIVYQPRSPLRVGSDLLHIA